MIENSIPRCEPPLPFRDLPYHWVQWRTPYRCDNPEPWSWDSQSRTWRALGGTQYTPERAEQMQWHYLAPAYSPATADDQPKPLREELTKLLVEWTRDRQLTTPLVELARLLTACHFAVRFGTSLDDRQVQLAVEQDWEAIGLPQAYVLLHSCGILDFYR